jgi:hypothetical protein
MHMSGTRQESMFDNGACTSVWRLQNPQSEGRTSERMRSDLREAADWGDGRENARSTFEADAVYNAIAQYDMR